MPRDRAILDAAQETRADLPFACKGGVCGTCRAKVFEGEVDMRRNYALEEDEVEAGFVLTCQTYPVSDRSPSTSTPERPLARRADVGRRRGQPDARHGAVAVDDGRDGSAMPVRDDMVNGHGLCHGGLVASLADSAFAGRLQLPRRGDGRGGVRRRLPGSRRAAGWRSRSPMQRSARFAAARGCTTSRCDTGDSVIAEFRGRSRTLR